MHGTDLPELPAEPGVTVPALGFTIVTRGFSSGTELVLIGELDHATRPVFDNAVSQALREGPPVLLLELSRLNFLAVAGARAFEEAHERCGRKGGRIVLVNPLRQVRRLLTLFDLSGLLLER